MPISSVSSVAPQLSAAGKSMVFSACSLRLASLVPGPLSGSALLGYAYSASTSLLTGYLYFFSCRLSDLITRLGGVFTVFMFLWAWWRSHIEALCFLLSFYLLFTAGTSPPRSSERVDTQGSRDKPLVVATVLVGGTIGTQRSFQNEHKSLHKASECMGLWRGTKIASRRRLVAIPETSRCLFLSRS